jgi:DNA-binding transcriptional regulator of glucitol operon
MQNHPHCVLLLFPKIYKHSLHTTLSALLSKAQSICSNVCKKMYGNEWGFKFFFVIAIVTTSISVYAQQSQFNKTSLGLNTEFTYAWQHQDAKYTLSFALETATLYAMPSSPPNYNPKIFQERVYATVMEKAQQIDPKTATIKVKKNHSGLSFNVSSHHPRHAQTVLDKLTLAHEAAQDNYWADNYFVKYSSPTGALSVRHDHAKYTTNSSRSLLPVVAAIKTLQQNPLDPREFITIALGWIQSIPYNRLEDRLSSNGAGFVSPRDLILQNQGDCDSKSTLMAALLKAYNSRIDVQMVYLPKHALLAINIQSMGQEITLRYKDNDYVLLEPTGPAQFSIGEVADSTKLSLRNRQFDLASMSL